MKNKANNGRGNIPEKDIWETNKEFDLSKKIIISNKYIDNFLYEEDVKEFIRLVKKEIENNISSTTIWGIEIKKQIDRFAGDKLK